MYFELDWKVNEPDLSNTGKCDDPRVAWTMGVRWERPVAQPIRCALNPARGPRLRDAYLINIPLFSERLLGAIRGTGVDNLQLFDAELTDLSGQIHTDYKAVNIIGAVKCADMSKSVYHQPEGYPFINFQQLVLDGTRTRGLDLFRLAEHPARILMSERVATAVSAISPVGIKLLPVETKN
jgi:hypothetical protein